MKKMWNGTRAGRNECILETVIIDVKSVLFIRLDL